MLDASAAVDVVLEQGPEGEWVAEELLRAESVHAPHLLDSELASALRRLVLAGEVSEHDAGAALDFFRALPVNRYPAAPLLTRIWELRGGLTAYDATYVALAESLDAPLVTTDRRLAAATGHRAVVSAFSG